MTPRKRRRFKNPMLNQPRSPYPPLPPRKSRTLNRVQHSQQCRSLDESDDQEMIDALLGEYGIAQIGPTAGARNAALERLVLAMASDGRRVPFAARKQGSRPVKDMFLFLEQLADHVEAEFTAHQEKEPDLLAACRHYKRKSGDKRTPRYLRDLYLEYRSHVKRGPTWLREFIANANLAARDHGS